MGMKKIADLAASAGEYKDAQGNEKKRWVRVGTLFQDEQDGRQAIKLDAVPVGEWSGWLSVFKDYGKQGQQPQQGSDGLPF